MHAYRDIRRFTEIDSTNRWLREASASGEAGHGTVAIADVQTVGRGRLDRKWIAPPKSALLMSVLIDAKEANLAFDRWPMVSFCMAYAVQDVANTFAHMAIPVTLKWPNDVIVATNDDSGSYRKLAGILVETAGSRLVVGVGVNLSRPEQVDAIFGTSASPVWLDELVDSVVDHQEFAESVLDSFSKCAVELSGPVDHLLDNYRSVLSTLGMLVKVERRGNVLVGKAVDVDECGRLVVVNDDGTHLVDASEVGHVRPL